VAEIRIGLVDSNELVRFGRTMMMNSQKDMRVVFEESDPKVALNRIADYLVDIIIVEKSQHGFAGSDFVSKLSKTLKEAGNPAKILASAPFTSDQGRWDSIASGAADEVGLDSSGSHYLRTIRLAAKPDYVAEVEFIREFGATQQKPVITRKLAESLESLEPQQKTILAGFLEGLSDQENAKRIDIAKLRVRQLIELLLSAGGFDSRGQLLISLRDRLS